MTVVTKSGPITVGFFDALLIVGRPGIDPDDYIVARWSIAEYYTPASVIYGDYGTINSDGFGVTGAGVTSVLGHPLRTPPPGILVNHRLTLPDALGGRYVVVIYGARQDVSPPNGVYYVNEYPTVVDAYSLTTDEGGGGGGCPPPNAPDAPTSPDMCEGAQVSLSVPALSGVLGYAWQRDGAQIATTSLPAFVDTGVTIGTQYSYTATAFNACGESDPSPAYLRTPCARAGEPDPRPDTPTTTSCDCCHWERAESPLAGPWARIAPPCDC